MPLTDSCLLICKVCVAANPRKWRNDLRTAGAVGLQSTKNFPKRYEERYQVVLVHPLLPRSTSTPVP
jgi:hypothetical protein